MLDGKAVGLFQVGPWGRETREGIWRLEREEAKPVAEMWGPRSSDQNLSRLKVDCNAACRVGQGEPSRLKQRRRKGCVGGFLSCSVGRSLGLFKWHQSHVRMGTFTVFPAISLILLFPTIHRAFKWVHLTATSVLHPQSIHIPFFALPFLGVALPFTYSLRQEFFTSLPFAISC